jgi:hypothetical protein
LALDLGVRFVPAVFNPADPPVLERQVHQTERQRDDRNHSGGRALALVPGTERIKATHDAITPATTSR